MCWVASFPLLRALSLPRPSNHPIIPSSRNCAAGTCQRYAGCASLWYFSPLHHPPVYPYSRKHESMRVQTDATTCCPSRKVICVRTSLQRVAYLIASLLPLPRGHSVVVEQGACLSFWLCLAYIYY